MCPKFNLSLLGRFVLTGPNGAVGLPNKKLSGLLAYLACTAPEPQPREKLSTLFWGSYFDAQAKQNLRQSLFKLRQILGRDALKSDGEFVSLNTTVILCDVSRFEALVREGGRDALGEAADLYRGRFVDDIGVTEEGWSDWLAGERQRFQELALNAIVGLGEKELAAGRADHALKAGQRASALNNMREDAHRLIMQALSATGRKAEALKYYQDVVTLLKRELNTEPDEATRALVAELRRTQTLIESAAVSEVEISAPPAPALMMVVDQPSIVVLPFRNMSDDPEQEYFADGVTEDIITALSRFREFVVIARGSSFAFKDRRLTSRQIAQQLGVQYVLSGNIRKAGNRIRVSAELTHARDEVQVWSDRYDRAIVDVFDLQDDISASVAAVIDPAVRSAEVERARRKPLSDLSAYDIYLRALPHLWNGTRDGITRAIVLLRQSLILDQLRPATLASLAWALVMASPLGAVALPETLVEALALARRAVEEDGTDAFAHAVYGFTLFGPVGNNDQGRIHCKEAVRLNPSSAFAWGILGMIDSMGGDYEHAVTCLHRSIALSPYDNMLHFWMTGLAASCFALGRPEDGVLWARNSIQQNPANGTGHRMLVANLVAARRLEEARGVTRQRDAVQKTTIAELRAMRFFKQDDALERYLSAQREAGVTD
ncbi:BTAD domain-containing putative transcriptional regulator [Tardiphaga robiniae]|uniref:BTAD domain-containing putative transcriptional regulator n=1 Tax=Tardiphaga robiniae TaxID=943830 RepID=UPI001FCD01FC|nr:BTAD domain-containing putative transcriptional regulator [Tardiphaga robiniae]